MSKRKKYRSTYGDVRAQLKSHKMGQPLRFPSQSKPDEGDLKIVWASVDYVEMQQGLELGRTTTGRPVGRWD